MGVLRSWWTVEDAEFKGDRSVSRRATVEAGHPVVDFLTAIGLGEFADPLLRKGYDDVGMLVGISDDDVHDAGLKRGHAVKLKLKLREHVEAHARRAPAIGHVKRRSSAQPHLPVVVPPAATPMTPGTTAPPWGQVPRSSWLRVQEIGVDVVAQLMPRYMFGLMPEAAVLFPPDVREKYRAWTADEGAAEGQRNVFDSPGLRRICGKVVNVVGGAVSGMHDWEQVAPMLKQLGLRHAGYGVAEDHLPLMGEALIRSLQACLGQSFTQEVERAWTGAFECVAGLMREGLRQLPRAGPPA